MIQLIELTTDQMDLAHMILTARLDAAFLREQHARSRGERNYTDAEGQALRGVLAAMINATQPPDLSEIRDHALATEVMGFGEQDQTLIRQFLECLMHSKESHASILQAVVTVLQAHVTPNSAPQNQLASLANPKQ